MALIRWNPRQEVWDPFTSLAELHDEVNRLFGASLRHQNGFDRGVQPAIDVAVEKDNGDPTLICRTDQGRRHRDPAGQLSHHSGEKKHETEQKEANYFLSERIYGSFTANHRIADGCQREQDRSALQGCVLQVTLPKTEDAKPKQIEVKAG